MADGVFLEAGGSRTAGATEAGCRTPDSGWALRSVGPRSAAAIPPRLCTSGVKTPGRPAPSALGPWAFASSHPSRELSDYRPSSSPLRTFSLSHFFTSLTPEPLNPLTPARPLRARAFSLVELLAVVGIIAILSVAAVPVMRGLGGSQSSRATAQILVSAIEQARTAAIMSSNRESGWGAVVFPSANSSGFPETHRLRSYAVFQDGRLISKWEILPGNLQFSPQALSTLTNNTNLSLSNAVIPGNTNWSGNLPAILFEPSGGLANKAEVLKLIFASSNKVSGTSASVADAVEVAPYSGRVRYLGITNNVNF